MANVQTIIRKTFLKRQDGLWQEIYQHFVQFTNLIDGSSFERLDKTVQGGIYKEAKDNEHSKWGMEETFISPDDGQKKRLIAVWFPPSG